MSQPRSPSCHHSSSTQGFGLVELLVASAVGALVIIATTTVFVPQLRMHQRLEGRTRLQERWARLQYLLDTEIQESHSVAVIANGLQLTTCAVPPNPSDTYTFISRCSDGATTATGTPGTDVTITYVLDPATQVLRRTGPPINRRGQLDTSSAPNPEILTTGVLEFMVPNPTNQTVQYTLAFRDPLDPKGSTYTNKSSAARARIKKL
jgi:hypothetical protein